jgi:hypothetical protein
MMLQLGVWLLLLLACFQFPQKKFLRPRCLWMKIEDGMESFKSCVTVVVGDGPARCSSSSGLVKA